MEPPELQEITVLPCGQIFCFECIITWFQKTTTCPVCNAVYNRANLVRIIAKQAFCITENYQGYQLQSEINSLKSDIARLQKTQLLLKQEKDQDEEKTSIICSQLTNELKIHDTRRISVSAKFSSSEFCYIDRKVLLIQAKCKNKIGIRLYFAPQLNLPPKFIELPILETETLTKIRFYDCRNILILTSSNNLFKISNMSNVHSFTGRKFSAISFGVNSSEIFAAGSLDSSISRYENFEERDSYG